MPAARYDSVMESRTSSDTPDATALFVAPFAVILAQLVSGCGGDQQSSAESSVAGTARLEYWDPETTQLIKSRGTVLYGQFIGEREWFHRNQTLAKKGQYDNQGREIGEWMEYHQIGSPAARYAYVDGALDGDLVRWHETGEEAERGQFQLGKQVGEWTTLYPSGKIKSKRSFVDGLEDGQLLEYWESGAIGQRGRFVSGKKEGVFESLAEDGTVLQRVEFSADAPVSAYEAWYPSGQRQHVAETKDGLAHGSETYWFESGQVRARRSWEAGQIVGVDRTFHENGQRHIEVVYQNGLMEGVLRSWHPSGSLQALVNHEAGARIGVARDWAPDGQLLAIENYVAGKRSGLQQTWHSNGLRKSISSFTEDQLTGERFVWNEAGQLMDQLSGIYEQGRKVGSLDEAARARAAELAGSTAALPVETETPDPFLEYDLNGERRSG